MHCRPATRSAICIAISLRSVFVRLRVILRLGHCVATVFRSQPQLAELAVLRESLAVAARKLFSYHYKRRRCLSQDSSCSAHVALRAAADKLIAVRPRVGLRCPERTDSTAAAILREDIRYSYPVTGYSPGHFLLRRQPPPIICPYPAYRN